MSRQNDFNPKSRFSAVGIVVMGLFHIAIGYALMTGLARKAIELVKKPLEATIIEEVKLPPPPPPPPPKQIVKQEIQPVQPVLQPDYVPPPQVVAPSDVPAAAITAVQTAVAVAPSPPVPPAPIAPAKVDISVACPKQVKPVIPDRAVDEGISGKVHVEMRIKGGRVTDIKIVSGPKVFHAAVKTALQQYQCTTSGADEILTAQDFDFKVE